MRLDERLSAVLSEIEGSKRIVDVGADHGKLCVAAVMQGRAERAVAVDISAASLLKARVLAENSGVFDNLEFVVADGANYLWNLEDTVVIAGMGGDEIVRIVGQKPQPKRLILVAHKDTFMLRRYLNERRLYVVKDYTVAAACKFYDVIVVDKGWGRPYDEFELYIGKNLPPTLAFEEKIDARLKKLSEYINDNASYQIKREKEILEDAVIKRSRCGD